jgi:Fe-S-cluster-containing hydrogenase component 2
MAGDKVSSYETTGTLTHEHFGKNLPPKERLEKRPVAVIECIQKIPCDPCAYVCKFGAIRKKSLVDPPEVDYEKCTGCGECIAICPGLAIFVLNLKYKNDEALVMIPYELLPTPKRGETWEALDREGKKVGEARIIATRMKNRTAVVTIAVKKHLAMNVRNIGRKLK